MRPETTTIIIEMSDGSVSIMAFVTRGLSPTLPFGAQWVDQRAQSWTREPSDANVFAELLKTFPAHGVQPLRWAIAKPGEIPADRTYRGAWTHDEGGFAHDMVKARAIHLDRVRASRAIELERLDKDWMRATGQNDKRAADAIEAQRQTLRDAPQTLPVDAAQTIDALNTLWPEGLPR